MHVKNPAEIKRRLNITLGSEEIAIWHKHVVNLSAFVREKLREHAREKELEEEIL